MKKLLLLLAAATCHHVMGQTLVINELMQSNIDCVMDDLNDYPDSWVELYNPTSAALNLQDYKIGTKENASKAWQLPSRMVPPGQRVLIYCDKAGEDAGVSPMHTDFRLESGKGCNVYLFKGETVCDEVIDLKKQPAPNIAYGRKTDGNGEWGYQQKATPGAANYGQLCQDILKAPEFSRSGSVMAGTTTFSLTLSAPDGSPAGTTIRYTLDGSEPTLNSPLYQHPITISKTTIVRATLFCNGWLSPRSACHSYIMFPNNRALTLPVISIMTDKKHLDDPKIGIYVDGTYQNGKKNYQFDWRRPINLEYFETADEDSRLNQLCETRIAGGATRSNALKTLAVYANKRFGEKRFSYEFFPDQRPGQKDFKSLMLRNAGNDFDYLYLRDAIIQRNMASHTDLDWQAWRPAIVYINGVYKGMLNIRERSNEDNIYTNYDGLEDIDMFENWNELKEGDWDNYNAFKAFYTEHGHTLAEYAEWMDWKEFLNLMVMNLYYNNLDAPGNNIVMWRPKASGGKWRWIAKDTDFGLGLYGVSYGYKSLEWINNPNYDADHNWGANGYEGTRLFRRLMEDADFKREFIDRACIYMGDFLNEQGTWAVWDPMYEQIKTEFPEHRKLYQYNQWWPAPYADEMNNARNWVKYRTNAFYTQLGNYYGLGTPIVMTINKGTEDMLDELTFNGVKLSRQVFDGRFFPNRQMTITGKAVAGKEITGWKVKIGYNTSEVSGDVLTMVMPQTGSVVIQPVIGEASGINTVTTVSPKEEDCAVYNLRGQQVTTPQRGHVYVWNGKKMVW